MMKKNVMILLAMLCSLGKLWAQDTVWYGDVGYLFPPRGGYAFQPARLLRSSTIGHKAMMTKYYPTDTLWVVGVAVVMDTLEPEKKPQATMWQRGEQSQWVMIDTTVWAPRRRKLNYFCLEGDYIDTTTPEREVVHYKETKPLYEFYFSTPHLVTDTFYVGLYHYAYSLLMSTRMYVYMITDSLQQSIMDIDPRYTRYVAPNERGPKPIYPLCEFPIVRPYQASAAVEEAVGQVEWQVHPNPATDGAEVLCDKPMEWIELVTEWGAVVERHTHVGTHYRLDLEGLPSGIYLVRIGTADGSVGTKRLVKP